jgi:outer membrane receptor protein involved in Fe transport
VFATDVRYVSKVFFGASNRDSFGNDTQSQRGFALWNGRLDFVNEENDFQIGVFVRNITKKAVALDGNNIGPPFLFDLKTFSLPRTWGVSVSARF